MTQVLGPRFVRKAGLWCVTLRSVGGNVGTKQGQRVIQKQEWFTSELQAKEFVNKQRGGD